MIRRSQGRYHRKKLNNDFCLGYCEVLVIELYSAHIPDRETHAEVTIYKTERIWQQHKVQTSCHSGDLQAFKTLN